jgi:hypothetical protein
MDLLSIDVHEMLISYQNKPINWTSVPARSPSICRPTRRKRDRVSVSVDLNRPAVVLVRPSHEGNVGSVARAMANTGLSELVLVEPAVQIGAEARAFAVGAGEILENLRRKVTLAGQRLRPGNCRPRSPPIPAVGRHSSSAPKAPA